MSAQTIGIFPVKPEKLCLFLYGHAGKCKIFNLDCRGKFFLSQRLPGRCQIDMHIPSSAGFQREITFIYKLLHRGMDGLFAEQSEFTDIPLETAVSQAAQCVQDIESTVRQIEF